TGIIRQRHGGWSTSPFRRVRETHRERTAKGPTRLTRIRLRPIRNDRGSCQQRGLPSNAPSLSWCRACVFHLQAPAEVPAALSSASRDATRRSPAAIWSSPQGDRRALYERVPRRFRQGRQSLKSAHQGLQTALRSSGRRNARERSRSDRDGISNEACERPGPQDDAAWVGKLALQQASCRALTELQPIVLDDAS